VLQKFVEDKKTPRMRELAISHSKNFSYEFGSVSNRAFQFLEQEAGRERARKLPLQQPAKRSFVGRYVPY